MTEIEAIMDLQEYIASGEYNGTNPPIYLSTANISIKALEKQIAKKPIKKPTDDSCLYYDSYCPCCEAKLLFRYNHCVCCGQKLLYDWGNEE